MIEKGRLEDIAGRLVAIDPQLARTIVQASKVLARTKKGEGVIKLYILASYISEELKPAKGRSSPKPRATTTS